MVSLVNKIIKTEIKKMEAVESDFYLLREHYNFYHPYRTINLNYA